MDAVYVCRPGRNEALRYSLRSLALHVHHDNVWIYGDAPEWVARDEDLVRVVERPRSGSKYDTVTAHIRAACENPAVSDPFVLWNDDFFAVEPVGPVPMLHRGRLLDELARFGRRNDEWGRGLRGAVRLLERETDGPRSLVSYELHAPLVIRKTEMLVAIRLIEDDKIPSSHRRTVYGNIARLGGMQIPDPKVSSRAWPTGQWVSSGPATFKSWVLPRLERLFPVPGPYETAI